MLELVVGAALIGVFVSSTVPMVRWVHLSSRINEQKSLATQEVANQMEHLAALPAAERTAEHLDSLAVSDTVQTILPDAKLTTIAETSDGLQKLTLTLTWTGSSSVETYSTHLTAWLPAAVSE